LLVSSFGFLVTRNQNSRTETHGHSGGGSPGNLRRILDRDKIWEEEIKKSGFIDRLDGRAN